MSETLSKTLKENSFDAVFTEVAHTESLGLKNGEALRLFCLDVRDNKFSQINLQKFLMRNIGRYVFSRAQLEQFRVDDDLDAVSAEALRILRKNSDADVKGTGAELGEMLIYAFLEEKLGAPKLMSRIELTTDAMQYGSNCDCIHLLAVDPSGAVPYYQLVFGASNVVGDMKDAIDRAFESIIRIESSSSNESQMVEKTVMSRMFSESDIAKIEDVIVPQRGRTTTCDTAYGVFLGYTLGLDSAAYTTAEFRNALALKMERDIKEHAAYITQKIHDNNLGTHAFYFYILPFNEAETEKKEIMTRILKGDVAL